MTFELGKNSVINLAGVNDDAFDVIELALKLTSVDFGIPSTGGYRTKEDQNILFKKGLSMCDGVIKKSYHQSGNAFDVFAYVDGKASYQKHHLTVIACAILQAANQLGVEILWGGHFKTFLDMPHYQLGD